MFRFGLFLSLCTALACGQLCSDNSGDPCLLSNNQPIRNEDTRHPSIQFSNISYNVAQHCDLYTMNGNTWYRSEYNMTSSCVGYDACGTTYPIWMNGTMPVPEDGIVDRVGCLRNFYSCCDREYSIRVKNCYYYTVYCLLELPSSCPQRYCFDIDLSLVTPTTPPPTTTTSTTTTTAADLPRGPERSKDDKPDCLGPLIPVLILVVALLMVVVCLSVCLYQRKRVNTFVQPKLVKSAYPGQEMPVVYPTSPSAPGKQEFCDISCKNLDQDGYAYITK